MTLLYADTSALVRAYFEDEPDHAPLRERLLEGGEPVVTSELARVELASAIRVEELVGTLDLLSRDTPVPANATVAGTLKQKMALIAATAGIVGSVLGAVIPARRAARAAPIDAFRPTATYEWQDPTRPARQLTTAMVGAAMMAGGLAFALRHNAAPSNRQVMVSVMAVYVGARLEAFGVTTEHVRLADHVIEPGVVSEAVTEQDEWPSIHAKVLAADIVVFATPTWLGQPSSVVKRALERLIQFLLREGGDLKADGTGRSPFGRCVGPPVVLRS